MAGNATITSGRRRDNKQKRCKGDFCDFYNRGDNRTLNASNREGHDVIFSQKLQIFPLSKLHFFI